jgi:CubicO group peptidase (beta-lactamase class C family)
MRQDLNTEEESDRYLEMILWQPPTWSVQTTNVIEFFYALHNNRPHGNEFQYNSIMSNMLGWIVQRAAGTRLHELASEVLWKPMGAQCDASMTLDGHGNAITEMGLSATLLDMVRWAEMLRCGGMANGRRVLSQEWIDDTVIPEHDSIEAFKTNGPRMLPMPGAYYRNQWWVARSREHGGVYCALGMNGQIIMIHEAAEVVLVKLSCWSEKSPDELAHPTIEGMISLADSLALADTKVG